MKKDKFDSFNYVDVYVNHSGGTEFVGRIERAEGQNDGLLLLLATQLNSTPLCEEVEKKGWYSFEAVLPE